MSADNGCCVWVKCLLTFGVLLALRGTGTFAVKQLLLERGTPQCTSVQLYPNTVAGADFLMLWGVCTLLSMQVHMRRRA